MATPRTPLRAGAEAMLGAPVGERMVQKFLKAPP